jgi:hypothetical protein
MSPHNEASAEAFRDLEENINNLARLAKIMAYLAHEPPSAADPDGDDLALHALDGVYTEIMALKKKYHAAYNGPKVQS